MVWDYGPTMSGSWTSRSVSELLSAIGYASSDDDWPIEQFRDAMQRAPKLARMTRAFPAIDAWLAGVLSLDLAPGTRVYVA